MSSQQKLNTINLGSDQVERLRQLLGNIRRNTIDLAREAFEIHSQHIQSNGKYDSEWEKWWNAYDLQKIFGSRGNWTKWHQAGAVINKFETRLEKHFAKLPTSRDALRAIGDLSDDELSLCLENRYTRTEITADTAKWKCPKKPQPVVHPSATASSIDSWRVNWRQPKGKSKNERRRLPFATIYVHGEFYDFGTDGEYLGRFTAEELRDWLSKLQAMFTGKEAIVRIEGNVESLVQGQLKREIKAAEDAKKLAAKKEKSIKKA